MSVQELETAVQLEKEKSAPLERQLHDYALYRRTARRMAGPVTNPVFAMHYLEFALSTWGATANAAGEVCTAYWDRFCHMMYGALYDSDLLQHEAESRRRWIEEAAYFRWLNSGCQHDYALDHWFTSEREYDALVQETGIPPDMAARLAPHFAIARQLERLG